MNLQKIKTNVSFKIYWRFQCTSYMFDLSKNWLRKSKLKNNQIIASDVWQRSHYSVVNMTFYNIPKAKTHLTAESLSVSFYGNGKCFSLVPLEIASTVCMYDTILLLLNPLHPRNQRIKFWIILRVYLFNEFNCHWF